MRRRRPSGLIAGARVLDRRPRSIGIGDREAVHALGATSPAIRRTRRRRVPEGVAAVHAPDRLRDVLPAADVVVIAAPQTPETRS